MQRLIHPADRWTPFMQRCQADIRKANERQKSKTATKTLEQTNTPNPISQ